jgi:hypothetical protein
MSDRSRAAVIATEGLPVFSAGAPWPPCGRTLKLPSKPHEQLEFPLVVRAPRPSCAAGSRWNYALMAESPAGQLKPLGYWRDSS